MRRNDVLYCAAKPLGICVMSFLFISCVCWYIQRERERESFLSLKAFSYLRFWTINPRPATFLYRGKRKFSLQRFSREYVFSISINTTFWANNKSCCTRARLVHRHRQGSCKGFQEEGRNRDHRGGGGGCVGRAAGPIPPPPPLLKWIKKVMPPKNPKFGQSSFKSEKSV